MISNNKLPNSSNIMQMHSNMHGSQITQVTCGILQMDNEPREEKQLKKREKH